MLDKKNFREIDFYGRSVFVETCFTAYRDSEAKTCMVVEPDYTDFNAVLIYDQEADAIRILPRWQTNFVLKDEAIYIIREQFDGQ
ncbi:hypothetical protein [Streptococcus cuniculipharyngis]|uniref:Uncharacterized protein n=1 Tax=Streptococcus cuniculipharyngis TaxID=1562651 RepID=A0A5C5S9M5_9STRE|nr:hypothetical protein [Streptococcus cuniculipharyngis]TWS96680.1 hypothetical protein FRX57_06860 [Streptococcus cuniculipharyngis]